MVEWDSLGVQGQDGNVCVFWKEYTPFLPYLIFSLWCFWVEGKDRMERRELKMPPLQLWGFRKPPAGNVNPCQAHQKMDTRSKLQHLLVVPSGSPNTSVFGGIFSAMQSHTVIIRINCGSTFLHQLETLEIS